MITSKGQYFLTDTHVQADPSAEELAEIAIADTTPGALVLFRPFAALANP